MADLKAKSRTRWRGRGYYVQNGETMMRVPGGITRRHDHLGFADLIAIPLDIQTWWLEEEAPNPFFSRRSWIYLQATSWANVPARRKKILYETTGQGKWTIRIAELALAVLDHGDLVIIEGWRKKKGSRLYELRQEWITREQLEEALSDGT